MNSHDNPVALPDWPNSATTMTIREMSGKRGRAFRPDGREIVVSIPER